MSGDSDNVEFSDNGEMPVLVGGKAVADNSDTVAVSAVGMVLAIGELATFSVDLDTLSNNLSVLVVLGKFSNVVRKKEPHCING